MTIYADNAATTKMSRAAFYAGQLRSYARALTRICRKPVRECALYFLSVGETVIVPFSES